jgi:hypothetical protein
VPAGANVSGATRIGCIVPGKGVAFRDDAGNPIEVAAAGYRHF